MRARVFTFTILRACRKAWAYKYDNTGHERGIDPHADAGAVSVNLWLTDDDANLDPTTVRLAHAMLSQAPLEFIGRDAQQAANLCGACGVRLMRWCSFSMRGHAVSAAHPWAFSSTFHPKGGLLIWPCPPPPDWSFDKSNIDSQAVREHLHQVENRRGAPRNTHNASQCSKRRNFCRAIAPAAAVWPPPCFSRAAPSQRHPYRSFIF